MERNVHESIIGALQEMNTNPSARNFLESSKDSNPFQFFIYLSQIIMNPTITENIVSSCIVIMSSILRPNIGHPLNLFTSEFHSLDPVIFDSIKQSLFKCLTYQSQTIRLSAARCIGFLAKIEFRFKKWQNVFEQLNLLVHDTGTFGEWAPIGAISGMREIIKEAKIRAPIFQSASQIIVNSCFEVMAKKIDPELKVEVVRCLKKYVPIFVQANQSYIEFYQKILVMIMDHIPIDNGNLHKQLYSLLSTFLIKIHPVVTSDLIGQIFTSLLPDIASHIEDRQLHVILLCQKIAKHEKELFQNGTFESQFCITELLERNFDEIFLKIIANGRFEDFDEAESTAVTQYAALNTLYTFGSFCPVILYDDCVNFYATYQSNDDPIIQMSALCAFQVISSIQTDNSVSFVMGNIEQIWVLCGCENQILRLSALSVLKTIIINKKMVLFTNDHFLGLIQIIRLGLLSDLVTARYSINLFSIVCQHFPFDIERTLLGTNYGPIMEMLMNAKARPDASEKFHYELDDAIFTYIRLLPKNEFCKGQLIELLKKIINSFIQQNGSNFEDKQKSSDLFIIVGIIDALDEEIIPFGETILSTLIQALTMSGGASCYVNNAYSIILTISQIVFYMKTLALPYLNQLIGIIENAQTNLSPLEIDASSNLIKNMVFAFRDEISRMGEEGFSILQRLFNLLYTNLQNNHLLLSSVSPLLFAMAVVVNAISMLNQEGSHQFAMSLMEICNGYTKNLEYFVKYDFEAANSIADGLMNAFVMIIETFPTETGFISQNLKSVFIQVPIIVWSNKMFTRKTVELFLMVMLNLIKTVGRQNNVELYDERLRNFLIFANSPNSPYSDLRQLAEYVMKFYKDI